MHLPYTYYTARTENEKKTDKLERFLRKNILAVYFLHNLAIHFNNYYKYKTDFIYLSLNHPSVKTITSFKLIFGNASLG